MTGQKRYMVRVTEIHHYWGGVEAEAESQEAAEALAEDLFDSATSDDATLEFQTIVLTEDGEPVVWSEEAAGPDADGPHQKKPREKKEAER